MFQLVVPCITVVACFIWPYIVLLYHHMCLQAVQTKLHIAFFSVFALCEKLCHVTSVNPPVRWYNSTPIAQIFMKYCRHLLKSVKKIQVWLKSEEYRVIRNNCQGFNNLSKRNTPEIGVFVFCYIIEQHPTCLLHTSQMLYMSTLCDSTNINMIIELVPNCL